MLPPHSDWESHLQATGMRCLQSLSSLLCAADPDQTVRPYSRLLCAALGELGGVCYSALGGSVCGAEVRRAGAMLSLITKLDDQVIDAMAFHGGMITDRQALRRRVRAYLAPTLAAIHSGHASTNEPRCHLAAQFNLALAQLGSNQRRREHLLEVIAKGWEVQVEAVAVLTSHPQKVTAAEVAEVTRQISGMWLLMITLIGTLPDDAQRGLTPEEEQGILDWGFAVQRADALADCAKDVPDGLISTYLGHLTYARAPQEYLKACSGPHLADLYELICLQDSDRDCVDSDLSHLTDSLAALGTLPALFEWIRRHLIGRYLSHPDCRRQAGIPPFAGYAAAHEIAAAQASHSRDSCLAP